MVVDSKSQRLYAKIAKPISAVRPWQIPIIKEPPMPQSGGKGFSEQRSARLSHDDGGQRTRKQPDAVQQAFEARRHRFEKRNRSGADDIPAPENHASRNRDDSGHDDVNNSPFIVMLLHHGRFIYGHECAFLYVKAREKRDVRAPALPGIRSYG